MDNTGLDLLMNRKKVCKKKYNEETESYNNFNNYKKMIICYLKIKMKKNKLIIKNYLL